MPYKKFYKREIVDKKRFIDYNHKQERKDCYVKTNKWTTSS